MFEIARLAAESMPSDEILRRVGELGEPHPIYLEEPNELMRLRRIRHLPQLVLGVLVEQGGTVVGYQKDRTSPSYEIAKRLGAATLYRVQEMIHLLESRSHISCQAPKDQRGRGKQITAVTITDAGREWLEQHPIQPMQAAGL